MIASLLCGCSKDDAPKNQNDELVGSCWYQEINQYQAYTFYFALDSKCTEEWKTSVGSGDVTLSRKFEYKAPSITISDPKGGVLYIGTISGNKMTLKSSSDDKELELTKIR